MTKSQTLGGATDPPAPISRTPMWSSHFVAVYSTSSETDPGSTQPLLIAYNEIVPQLC